MGESKFFLKSKVERSLNLNMSMKYTGCQLSPLLKALSKKSNSGQGWVYLGLSVST